MLQKCSTQTPARLDVVTNILAQTLENYKQAKETTVLCVCMCVCVLRINFSICGLMRKTDVRIS